MQNSSQVDLARVHALVLDDHQNFVSIMRSILRGFGIRHIIETTDALRAIELIQHQPMDIAFIDLKMPLINGIEFTRLVRNAHDSPNRRLPIVLVTGNAIRSTITEAINAGIEEVLAKPLCPKNVYLRMMRLLQEPYEYVEFPGYFGPDRRRRVDHMYTGPERRQEDSDSAPGGEPRPESDAAAETSGQRPEDPAETPDQEDDGAIFDASAKNFVLID